MASVANQLPRNKREDVQLAFEALNDWHASSNLIDTRRPKYFSALVFSWFGSLATAFDASRDYLIWLIGRLGIVAVWFGAVGFFLLYADSFRAKRRLERLIDEARTELRELGLDYRPPRRQQPGRLQWSDTKEPFDPYDDGNFT